MDASREEAAVLVAQLAAESGNPHLASAAAWLRSPPGGRTAKDDADALRQIGDLVQSGQGRSPQQGAESVARTMMGEHSATAAARRLARKFRRTQRDRNPIKFLVSATGKLQGGSGSVSV